MWFPTKSGHLLFMVTPPASLVKVPPLFLTNGSFRCLSPDIDCEQLNLEILYYSPLFSQSLAISRYFVSVTEWMNDYCYHCLNFVKIGTERAKTIYLKSHDQSVETGLELGFSTFLSRNLVATVQQG